MRGVLTFFHSLLSLSSSFYQNICDQASSWNINKKYFFKHKEKKIKKKGKIYWRHKNSKIYFRLLFIYMLLYSFTQKRSLIDEQELLFSFSCLKSLVIKKTFLPQLEVKKNFFLAAGWLSKNSSPSRFPETRHFFWPY